MRHVCLSYMCSNIHDADLHHSQIMPTYTRVVHKDILYILYVGMICVLYILYVGMICVSLCTTRRSCLAQTYMTHSHTMCECLYVYDQTYMTHSHMIICRHDLRVVHTLIHHRNKKITVDDACNLFVSVMDERVHHSQIMPTYDHV